MSDIYKDIGGSLIKVNVNFTQMDVLFKEILSRPKKEITNIDLGVFFSNTHHIISALQDLREILYLYSEPNYE